MARLPFLSQRLIATLALLAFLVGLVNAATTFVVTNKKATGMLDDRLRDAALHIGDGAAVLTNTSPMATSAPYSVVIQVWRNGEDAPRSTEPEVRFSRDAPLGFSDPVIGGTRWRLFTTRGRGKLVQVAQRARVRTERADAAALSTLIPTLILLPLMWAAIAYTVRRSLRPLGTLSEKAGRIDPNRPQKLEASDVPREIQPFVDAINHMIARIGGMVEAEKKFIADAAHELRTPIAALQIQADNLERQASAERLTELRLGIGRASALIDQLLKLARADASLQTQDVVLVDAQQLITDLIADFLPIAHTRAIDLGVDRMRSVQIRVASADLRAVVRNLIENALRYTPSGGRVDVNLEQDSDGIHIQVRDTGPGIPESLLPRVFDRFFRANTEVEGSGLGLSIVKTLVAKHGGTTALANRTDGTPGLVADVRFPAEAIEPRR